MSRYEAIYGFNSKQWYAYDTQTDEYCDPPIFILSRVKNAGRDLDEQQKRFEAVLELEPDWLQDERYRFDAETIDI